MTRHSEKTLDYIRYRAEVEYPERIEHATQILARMSLEASGQLELFNPKDLDT